jgi:inorganic triphosphatase YgiF
VPVRLGVLTKAERGYALLGPAVPAFRADRVDLHRNITAAQAFQQVIQAGLRQFRQNEDRLLIGQAPEALHQARVALRRLRSALSIFKPLIADDASAGLRYTLRWLSAELGQVRSIDVLIERAPPGSLRDRLERAGQTAYARLDGVLASARARGLMLNVAQWSASGRLARCGRCHGAL